MNSESEIREICQASIDELALLGHNEHLRIDAAKQAFVTSWTLIRVGGPTWVDVALDTAIKSNWQLDVLIALLTATYRLRNELEHRNALRHLVEDRILALGLDPKIELSGL